MYMSSLSRRVYVQNSTIVATRSMWCSTHFLCYFDYYQINGAPSNTFIIIIKDSR